MRATWRTIASIGLAALALASCNAILGIEEPTLGTGGAGATTDPGPGGSAGNGGASGSVGASGDGGNGPAQTGGVGGLTGGTSGGGAVGGGGAGAIGAGGSAGAGGGTGGTNTGGTGTGGANTGGAGPCVCPDDSNLCTREECVGDPPTCEHIPDDAPCDDGKFCNGTERCDPTSGCMLGTPACQDSAACTDDTCDELAGSCTHAVINARCTYPETCDPTSGCRFICEESTCLGTTYACGDCIDNDGDGKTDAQDPECLTPCQNDESTFDPNIPGQNISCSIDCAFDGNSGRSDDDCIWDLRCDSALGLPQCPYNPNTTSSGQTCNQLTNTQSDQCADTCGPRVPNGCDCFGCCEFDVAGVTEAIYVGHTDTLCSMDLLANSNECPRCTINPSCFNPCDTCELCAGKRTLPVECQCQECPAGQQLCNHTGFPCGSPCPAGYDCLYGCCVPEN